MSDQEGFIMYPDMAMLFFRVCSRYKLVTPEDRKCVLRKLVKRKEAQYLRDVAPVLAGTKVLKVGFKSPHNDGPRALLPGMQTKRRQKMTPWFEITHSNGIKHIFISYKLIGVVLAVIGLFYISLKELHK